MLARFLWVPFAASLVLGCSSAEEVPLEPVPVECRDTTGNAVVACDITLQEPGGFRLSITGISSCSAPDNRITLILPEPQQLLTDNACGESVGTSWIFGVPPDDPYPTGTEIRIGIESFRTETTPGLRITGEYPTWTMVFEDGGDDDFNDLTLLLEAIPAP